MSEKSQSQNSNIYVPHPKQQEVHGSPARFKVLNWGRQTGKSIFSLHYAYYEAIRLQGRYWIVLPTYKQAKNIFWKQYIQMIPPELVEKKDAQDLSITLKNDLTVTMPDGSIVRHDKNRPPATIELKGSDDADNLRGAKVNGFVFDEYAFHKPDAWESVFRPMLSTTKGWALFISSPNGFNHFYDFAMRAKSDPTWFYSHATGYDNPAITKKELDKIKLDVSPLKWGQEYMAEFKQMEGLVYDGFDIETHVVQPEEIPADGTDIVAIDFGFTNPTAILYIRIDYDQNWWIYDEIYQSKMTTDIMGRVIKEKSAGKQIAHYIGDQQASEHIANLQRQGIPIVGASKTADSITAGINMITESLMPRTQIAGDPRPKMFISSVCKNLIYEFSNYSYPEQKVDRNEKEAPLKKNDHALDALRYAKLYMTHDVNEKVDIPKFTGIDDDGFF